MRRIKYWIIDKIHSFAIFMNCDYRIYGYTQKKYPRMKRYFERLEELMWEIKCQQDLKWNGEQDWAGEDIYFIPLKRWQKILFKLFV